MNVDEKRENYRVRAYHIALDAIAYQKQKYQLKQILTIYYAMRVATL